MTPREKEARPHETRPYKIGYGKPPEQTQFRKGQSGNQGGRPVGMTAGRAKALVLEEAYRLVQVEEGDDVVVIPAIQAILRSQIALATKGNGPAQRALVTSVRAIEEEMERQASSSEFSAQIALLLARASGRKQDARLALGRPVAVMRRALPARIVRATRQVKSAK